MTAHYRAESRSRAPGAECRVPGAKALKPGSRAGYETAGYEGARLGASEFVWRNWGATGRGLSIDALPSLGYN